MVKILLILIILQQKIITQLSWKNKKILKNLILKIMPHHPEE